jgi:hypothetical protein
VNKDTSTKPEITKPEMKGRELLLNEMTPLDPKNLEVVAGGMVIINEVFDGYWISCQH